MKKNIFKVGAFIGLSVLTPHGSLGIENLPEEPIQLETPLEKNLANSYIGQTADSVSYVNRKKILSKKEISDLVSEVYNKISSKRKIPQYMSKGFFVSAILAESSGEIYAESEVGARGLMQLRKNAWKQVETESYDMVFDPNKNVENGIKYYLWINNFCSRHHPNWKELSEQEKTNILHAGYNLGIPSLRDLGWNIENTNSETRTHVVRLENLLGS